MAVLLDPSRGNSGLFGTLAVVPLAGGTPRELLENVLAADWTPDGQDLCVARLHPSGEITIELPPGTVLQGAPRTRVGLDMLRFSRDGRYIAIRDWGARKVVLVDPERKTARPLLDLGANFWGLAWAPTGREVWFTESASMTARDVYAVDLKGRRRLVYRSPAVLSLVDTAPDGRALFHRALDRMGAMALLPGNRVEQDVTAYDSSYIGAVSTDGRMLLLNSRSEGPGAPSAYLIGVVDTWAIAPDGLHVAAKAEIDTIRILPLAGGPTRTIRLTDVGLSVSRWSGDGRSLFLARTGRWPCEIHRLDLATEKVELWKRATPPDPTGLVWCSGIVPSADGRSYAYSAQRSLASLIVAEGLR